MKFMKKGISLIVLIITIIVVIILAGAVILNLSETNIITQAQEAARLHEEMERADALNLLASESFIDKYINSTGCEATLSGTFIQPWLAESYTYSDWTEHCQILKRAGINKIIVQYVGELEGGKISTLSYDTTLVDNASNLAPSFDSDYYDYTKPMLDNLFKAAENYDMEVVLGLPLSSEWWDNEFEDATWRTNNVNMINTIATDLYNKYKASYPDTFTGWYWSFETYTSTENYETYWASMMSPTFAHLTSLDASLPVSISPFISTITTPTTDRVYEQFNYLVNNSGFRDGDYFYLQDGIGVIDNFTMEEVQAYTEAIKRAVDTNDDLNFAINVEIYTEQNGSCYPASFNRVLSQMNIASAISDELISFSYSHYYDPLVDDIDSEYNDDYLRYIATKNIPYSIPAPTGGSVYRDSNRDEAPIPAGFSVSTVEGEQTIEDGLVIVDSDGNEFVWIPVNCGIEDNGVYASSGEEKVVSYKKWCTSGGTYANSTDDTLTGITEDDQVIKYKGFYIGRYEAAFDYNAGDLRVAVVPSTNSTTSDWRTSRTIDYDGYVWNRIIYSDAKTYSSQMASSYSYDSSLSTSLVTGTQWDTAMKWLEANEINVHDSTSWGNYGNSVDPANTGNYVVDTLQSSGSNENWKVKNLYDLAGNLSEWSSELNSGNASQSYIRSADYNDNGIYGPASYRMAADGIYGYPNVGFRVALYID